MWLSLEGKQSCFDTVSQVKDSNGQPYACSYWANAPQNKEEACSAHGCTPFSDQCLNKYDATTPYGLPGPVAVSNLAQWDSVLQTAGTDEFTFHTKVSVVCVLVASACVLIWVADWLCLSVHASIDPVGDER
jgi:hypothetical protein